MSLSSTHYLMDLYEVRAHELRSEADNDRLAATARRGHYDDRRDRRGQRHSRAARPRLLGWLPW